jgi:hypothetical protein
MGLPATSQAEWAALLLDQDGVVSRRQALSLGWTTDQIQRHRRSGRWVRLHPGISFTFTGPVPWSSTVWAALLHAGPDAGGGDGPGPRRIQHWSRRRRRLADLGIAAPADHTGPAHGRVSATAEAAPSSLGARHHRRPGRESRPRWRADIADWNVRTACLRRSAASESQSEAGTGTPTSGMPTSGLVSSWKGCGGTAPRTVGGTACVTTPAWCMVTRCCGTTGVPSPADPARPRPRWLSCCDRGVGPAALTRARQRAAS